MTAHSELVARLEGASEGSRELDAAIADTFDPVPDQYDGFRGRWPFVDGSPFSDQTPPVTTSLEGALALAKRVLPGWRRHLNELPPSTGLGWEATVWTDAADLSVHPTRAPTPALAMSIAVLRAKEPQPDGEKT